MPSAGGSSLLFAASLCGVSSGVSPAQWRTQACCLQAAVQRAVACPPDEPARRVGRVTAPGRMTVDLSAYPDLVVIYLGMRVEEPHGLETLQRLGPEIDAAVEEQPDGLLLHERLMYSEEPLHVGMRQYWRDYDALEAWSLTLPHKSWWSEYLRDRGARRSGTRRISDAAVSRRCSSTRARRLACRPSRQRFPRRVRCCRRGLAPSPTGRLQEQACRRRYFLALALAESLERGVLLRHVAPDHGREQ